MVKLSDIELPLIYKNTLLFKAGDWNHLSFSKEVVEQSVKDTKWSSLSKRLYKFHDNSTKFGDWSGKVENVHTKDGNVFGDVEIWDADQALKIKHGGSPFAISADIEYQENAGTIDRVIFTGFALEYDPGVRDINMYLSDVVRNEMNGMFHARFSNVVEAQPEVTPEVKEEPQIDTQSTERRLEIKQDAKMEEVINSSETKAPEQPKMELNPLEARIQELEAKLNEMARPKEQPIEVPKVEPVEQKATIVESIPIQSVPNIVAMDEQSMTNMIEKIAEKMKPIPMTVNEFGSMPQDPEEQTIDRLAESLAN